jgi:hypothetical protein
MDYLKKEEEKKMGKQKFRSSNLVGADTINTPIHYYDGTGISDTQLSFTEHPAIYMSAASLVK